MILAALGTQDFQFDRLLKEIDSLIEEKFILDEVFAQIGYSSYIPLNFKFSKFVDAQKFNELIEKSDLIITHAGTGTIINSIKKGKKVIAVPRMKEFNEHVDNHQQEIVELFSEKNLIIGIKNVSDLREAILSAKTFVPQNFEGGKGKIINLIDNFIDENFKA